MSQPKNEKPVSDIQTVQLRKINQVSCYEVCVGRVPMYVSGQS